MEKKILGIIAILFYGIINSQELPKIIPPSPEASSLAKFTEIPVSHYTGIPNIGVPIHTINFDGMQIPIGLSYHARGIKVEEIASRIGIGWALNAGGAITRQIRGRDDFTATHGYYYQNSYEDFDTNSVKRNTLYDNDLSGDADLVPDKFSFNFLGYSGSFIFDQKTKNPILQSYDDLEIEAFGSSHFIITNSQGFKFYFGEPALANASREAKSKDVNLQNYSIVNDVVNDSNEDVGNDTFNTWHLVDIVSPNGRKISFNYTLEQPIFIRRLYDQFKDNEPSSFFTKYRGEQYQISEIVFDQGKVKFNKDTINPRQDLLLGYALKSIEIENNYQLIKKFNLEQSYSFDSNTTGIHPVLIYEDPKSKSRMFLDAITIEATDGSIEPYRSFDYTDKSLLPNRFSNSQDIWGYYNGKYNGRYLTFFSYETSFQVNRSVDSIKAMTGLINKVTYPTGGYSEYTFEPNKAIAPGYFKNLLFQNPNPVPISEKSFANLTNNSMYSNGFYESPVFSIDSSAFGTMNLNVSCLDFNNNCSGYSFSILNVDTTQSTTINFGTSNNNYPLLPLGNYKLVVHPSGSSNNAFSVTLQWNKALSTPQEGLVFSGGNRIKKIENNSIDNGKITRSYQYINESGESSGLVFSLPSYYFILDEIIVNGVVTPVRVPLAARPGSPITYEQGNHVGYSRVIEYLDSNTDIGKGGKTEYTFTAMPDGGEFYKAPYTLPVNNEWLRGKPLAIKHYKRNLNSSSYDIVKMENFVYKYADDFSHLAITNQNLYLQGQNFSGLFNDTINSLKFNKPLIVFKLDEYNSAHIGANDYKVYNLNGGIQKLSSKQETTYFDNSNSSTNTTNYFYDYYKHYQLKSTEAFNSNGETLKTINYYPTDVSDLSGLSSESNTAAASLLLKNRFEIIQKDVLKDTVLHSRLRTNYKNWDINLILPKTIQTSKGSQSLEDRIVYHDYDDKGNPLEVSKKDGTKIYYVWGYNKTQPIAKIENFQSISTSQQTAITNAISSSNSDSLLGTLSSENTLRVKLQELRDEFPNSMVTTFTYDPLIGVTSIADPRGKTVYYHYDSFNRLEFVKDNEGNILSENKYNYKN